MQYDVGRKFQNVPKRKQRGLRAELPFKLLLALIFLLTLLLGYLSQTKKQVPELISVADVSSDESAGVSVSEISQSTVEKFPVYISGGVTQPGVYEMSSGDIVDNLLTQAGGFTPDADRDALNLAAILIPHSQIYVPIKGEEGELGVVQESSSGLLDLNHCSKEDLQTVPGIGPKMAESIIRFRTSKGTITIEDLIQVPGIKEKRLEQLRPYFKP